MALLVEGGCHEEPDFCRGHGSFGLPIPAANAGIITVGDGFARSCYEASEAQAATPANDRGCDRAFTEQALEYHDEVATT